MDPTAHQVPPSPVPATPAAPPSPRGSGRRRALVQAGLLACVLGVAGASAARMVLSSDDEAEPGAKRDAVLTVTTVRPRAKTLVTSHTQPGTIAPWAQADLYAKASGYVSRLRREWTAELAAAVVARPALGPAAGSPLGGAIQSAADVELGLWVAPPVDIGSVVAAGDLLIEVDVPERTQDILEQETVLAHRQAELEQAHSMVETYQASLELAAAQKKQAQADVRRYQGELLLRQKELARIGELVRSDALNRAREEEKQAEMTAAQGALESSQAKVLAAEAEAGLAAAKLAAARTDIKVKEARVDEARVGVGRARVLAGYARLTAPFSGILTARDADEGDFVQNSQSGQTRKLLTLSSIDRVKAILQVPSREAVLIRVGARAVVTVDSLPGEPFRGRVARLRKALDVQSRTMQVEIDLPNRGHRLVPGMYGQVTLTLAERAGAYLVPAAALYSRKGTTYVLVVEDGVVRRQPVRLRTDEGNEVEVLKLVGGHESPLDGTEELVVSNKGDLAEGQRVTAVPAGSP